MLETLNTVEKRQFKRIPSNRPIVLLIKDKHIYGNMTDLSRNGVGFMSDLDAPIDEKVEVHFDLPQGNNLDAQSFQFKAKIVHCIDCHDGYCTHNGFHIGVRLELPDKRYGEILEQLAIS